MKHKIHYSISGELLPGELGELLVGAFSITLTPQKLSKLIANSTVYAAARHSGRLVGFGRVLSDDATIAYINYMAVHPDYRKQGIGQHILKLLVEAAGDVHSVYLYTNTADSLYQHNGFQRSEKRLYVLRK